MSEGGVSEEMSLRDIADRGLAARAATVAVSPGHLMALIRGLEPLRGTHDHPEHYCHRCGGRNLHSWYADSDLWNKVDPPEGILCPICFVVEAEARGIAPPSVWRVAPADNSEESTRLFVRLHETLERHSVLRAAVREMIAARLDSESRILGRELSSDEVKELVTAGERRRAADAVVVRLLDERWTG